MKFGNNLPHLLACILLFSFTATVPAQAVQEPFPVKKSESPETWQRGGWTALETAKNVRVRKGKAKNVILFLGDGMSTSTPTAARIFEGQQRGESGEENSLSFELFPFTALAKTYSVNQQTSDSAPTISAIVTGVKTNDSLLSVNQNVRYGNYQTVAGNEATSILEYAERSGRSTGVVSTARLTHATPGACYAHTAAREWESDADIYRRSTAAHTAGFPDIARQLIESKYGDGLEVAMGGGRSKFIPNDAVDPEYPDGKGERLDGRDLTREWVAKRPGAAYVWNREQFDALDVRSATRILGLFEPSHMQYEHNRQRDLAGEPSLAEMTSKAIDLLSKNKKGFFLMVEGGRIDHGHHDGNAFNALNETVALSTAVRTALAKVDLDETLIVVTSDHSHTMFLQGYPARGNNILGLVREPSPDGGLEKGYAADKNKKPYTTLGYANGKGARKGERPTLSETEVLEPGFLQEAHVPLGSETHSSEDVAIFAIGVNAHLVRGSMEQNWIFYVMADAMRVGRK